MFVSDIYEYADEYNADYYDMNTGKTFHVQDYNRLRRMGLPTPGIAVTIDGILLGYAQRMEDEEEC